MKINIKRFDKSINLPKYEKLAAGFDFICREGATINPGEIKSVPSNIAVEIPEGYFIMITARSSTPPRLGLMMPHAAGINDPFYNGNEIKLIFYNFTDKPAVIKKGDKIAQGVLVKYETAEFEEVEDLKKSERRTWTENKRRK